MLLRKSNDHRDLNWAYIFASSFLWLAFRRNRQFCMGAHRLCCPVLEKNHEIKLERATFSFLKCCVIIFVLFSSNSMLNIKNLEYSITSARFLKLIASFSLHLLLSSAIISFFNTYYYPFISNCQWFLHLTQLLIDAWS